MICVDEFGPLNLQPAPVAAGFPSAVRHGCALPAPASVGSGRCSPRSTSPPGRCSTGSVTANAGRSSDGCRTCVLLSAGLLSLGARELREALWRGWCASEPAAEWRVGDSDLAGDIGGYDAARFELHVLDEKVVGAPDGKPDPTRAEKLGSGPPELTLTVCRRRRSTVNHW